MKSRRVYLYVFHTMSDWEYGYLIAELNSGRYFKKGLEPLKVTTIASNQEMITTMGGLSIKPDKTLDQCIFEKEDLIILPGGNNWDEESHQVILKKVGKALTEGTLVAAICGATDALANKGYLDTRKHTSNSLEYTKMICPNYQGEKHYDSGVVVSDGQLITASGIAPLEFSKAVLEELAVFKPETLQAWYELNKTQNPEFFFQLMQA